MINEKSENPCVEIRANIPWYVNGTLSNSTNTKVRNHIDHCEVCQTDWETHRLMRNAVLDRELTPIVPATTAEELFRANHSDQRGRTLGERVVPWSMALAACLAIVTVTFIFFYDSFKGVDVQNQSYETATSAGSTEGIDYVLQLHFDDRISAEQRAEIAAGLAGAVRWTVDDRGTYEVHLRLAAPSLGTLQDFEVHVGSMPGVESAEFTALQLPMK